MIDPNKCQVCFPIVAQIFEMKFEGEKEIRKCVLRAWKECEEPATEHIVSYVDPAKKGTEFVLHRCAKHTLEAKQLHDAIQKTEKQ